MLEFEAGREPVPPKNAATVVVIRDAAAGLEVFCVERHARSGFLGGAVVFPGGKLAPFDGDARWESLTTPLSARARALAEDGATARAFAVAALRELLEEAALLPVVGAGLDDTNARALRDELAHRVADGVDESLAFAELLDDYGLVLDTARLEGMSRWITPVAESRRYDTRFYVLALSESQSGAHDARETTKSFWSTPREVLARSARGEIFLAPPTSSTLGTLSASSTTADALALAQRHPLHPICPFFVMDGNEAVLALPGDPLYPETRPTPEEGPTRFVLRDGHFVGERR